MNLKKINVNNNLYELQGSLDFDNSNIYEQEHQQYVEILIDNNDKILRGVTIDGETVCDTILSNKTTVREKLIVGKSIELDENCVIGENFKQSISKIKNASNESNEPLPYILNAAYSSVGLGHINSTLHFLSAIKAGFNSLKCDVRLTSDNIPILCHDAYFTFDDNGRIKSPNVDDIEHNVYINTLTYEQVKELEYNTNYIGVYDKVCTLDMYLQICMRYNVVPYITSRQIDDIPFIVDYVKKYNLSKYAIINLYPASVASVAAIRKLDKFIKISYTVTGCPTRQIIEELYEYGNIVITLFEFPIGGSRKGFETIDDNIELINYAKSLNFGIHTGQVGDRATYEKCLSYGITGFHLTRPLLDIPTRRIVFKIQSNGSECILVNYLSNEYIADCTINDNNIIISNIRYNGSFVDIQEVLPYPWKMWFPYEISIDSVKKQKCYIEWNVDGLMITANDINDTFMISITI